MKRTALLLGLALAAVLLLNSCKATGPGQLESELAIQAKKVTIGGKDVKNPIPNTPESVKMGAEHFQHHCQVCHGLDGHNTGVPFAAKMSPPVLDLGEKDVQNYTDGQLKWIVDNGIRFTGMPGWKGILDDEEGWHIVNYIRHLPAKGSLGVPDVYKEGEEQHEEAKGKGSPAAASSEKKPHTHTHSHNHEKEGEPHKH
jgi:mono/diheme cytochrome c family protein